jgi:hypothetical protein
MEFPELWNAEIKARTGSTARTAKKQIDDNLPVILDSINGVVMGLPGYQARTDRSKSTVIGGIETMKRTTNELKELNGLVAQQIETLGRTMEEEKKEVARLKSEAKETDQLTALRKEQAAELKTKYASNLHTSWLGLWRPMREDSYTGLLVASVVFGLIALLSLFFLLTRPFLPIAPEAVPFAGAQRVVGGALRKIARLH